MVRSRTTIGCRAWEPARETDYESGEVAAWRRRVDRDLTEASLRELLPKPVRRSGQDWERAVLHRRHADEVSSVKNLDSSALRTRIRFIGPAEASRWA